MNFGTKKKPKYETRYRKSREVEVFNMTSAKDKYNNYTIIKGFEGNSEEDLKNKIDTYLEELMAIINEPLHDCPHCKGMGVILNDKK